MKDIFKYSKPSSGFTLIELLVVIAIIGSLSALLVPNFMLARERARDVERKSDLNQIQKALELYKLDQAVPSYPDAGDMPTRGAKWQDKTTGNVYMNKFPGDPKDNTTTYQYVKSDSLDYDLEACLENSADSDGKDCQGAILDTCTSKKCFIVNQP